MKNKSKVLGLLLALVVVLSSTTGAFADIQFVRYVTRYEVHHYEETNEPVPYEITRQETVYGSTRDELNAKISASLSGGPLGFKGELGAVQSDTSGFSCTIIFKKSGTKMVTFRQEVIHKNIYVVYRTNELIAPESIGDSPTLERMSSLETPIMIDSEMEIENVINTGYRTFEVLYKSTFYKYGEKFEK